MKQTFDFLQSNKTCYLSELLPYDPKVKFGVRLLSGLKEYLLLLYAAEMTINFIQQGEINNFDPLVGENACQIRAVKIAEILNNIKLSKKIYTDILRAKEKIKYIIDQKIFQKDKKKSLNDFIISDNLDIATDEDIIYMIRSLLLSKIKLLMPPKIETPLYDNLITKPKLLQDIYPVSIVYAEKFIKQLRVDLSESSVSYIKNLSITLPFSELCIKMLSESYTIRYLGLECIPYYYTTQVLVQHLRNLRIPIILLAEQRAIDKNYQTIRKTMLYFEATAEGYKKTDYIPSHSDKPTIIVCGTSNAKLSELSNQEMWVQELQDYSIIDLILAHAASHRQYPDESKETILFNVQDQSYQYYKTKADLWGCSTKNPSRFFITHIYCEKTQSFIKNMTIQSEPVTRLSTTSKLVDEAFA